MWRSLKLGDGEEVACPCVASVVWAWELKIVNFKVYLNALAFSCALDLIAYFIMAFLRKEEL